MVNVCSSTQIWYRRFWPITKWLWSFIEAVSRKLHRKIATRYIKGCFIKRGTTEQPMFILHVNGMMLWSPSSRISMHKDKAGTTFRIEPWLPMNPCSDAVADAVKNKWKWYIQYVWFFGKSISIENPFSGCYSPWAWHNAYCRLPFK